MKSFIVSTLDDNQRLNRFLEKVVPGLYPSMMYKYLRNKSIKVNGKRTSADTRLKKGDEVTLYISDDFFEKKNDKSNFMQSSTDISVIYEDKNIAIMNKPVGLVAHSDFSNDTDTLVNRFLHHLVIKKEYNPSTISSFTPALCNRLDRDTSGLIIGAKKPSSLKEMNLMIKQYDVKKYYLTVTTSKSPKDGTYVAYHQNAENNQVKVSFNSTEKTKEIITNIRTIYENNGLYVVEVELVTGRKHQIRAHLALLGCPILGDPIYGDKEKNRAYNLKKQILTSYKLSFVLSKNIKDYPTLSYLDGKTFDINNSISNLCTFVNKKG